MGQTHPMAADDGEARIALFLDYENLAIGAREPMALPARQSVQTLAFLGRTVAAALAR